MKPNLVDVSVPETGATQVWQSVPGYTGKGVIVGIIDTGIDWRRSDFKGADGSSRILYIWDQTIQMSDYALMGYGTERTKEEIDSGQCLQTDPAGHGTHVASIAAGSGRGMSGFVGMAPEADIIAVKTSFYDAEILDAVGYIMEKAFELNKPVVINMSFGTILEWPAILKDAIDTAYNAGIVVVAGAGNSGTPTGEGNNIWSPARHGTVIAVGATDESDARYTSSSTGYALET